MEKYLITDPHIYKKGKILKFKRLDDGISDNYRKYIFSSIKHGTPYIISACNNINQIIGRNWLGIHKLLSYFGISKDPSEKLSKEPSIFNKFFKNLREGEKDLDKELKEIKKLLKDNSEKMKNLEETLGFNKPREEPISRKEVLDLLSDIKEMRTYIRQIVGKE